MDSFFKGKKVLVCGGAGFIGSNLLLKLLDSGCYITSVVHIKSPQIKDRRIKYLRGDLCDRSFCQKVCSDQDYVFMCAANTSGAGVIFKTPLVHVTPNIIMNTLMLEASYEARVKKFLFISSSAVYPSFNHPVVEDEMMAGEPFEKYFPVAWMKRFSEILCEIYATKIAEPMKIVVVRPANVYGPYDDFSWETSHVVPALIRKVVERQNPLEVWGDGRDIKDLIYVDDLVLGMLLAIEKIDTYRPVNLGTGVPVSIRDVVRTILAVEGLTNVKVVFNKSKPTMIPKRLINVNLAKKLLGFSFKIQLLDGVRRTVEWYRESLLKS